MGSGSDVAAIRAGGGTGPAVCADQRHAGRRARLLADLYDYSPPPLRRTAGSARHPFQSLGASTRRTTGRPWIVRCVISDRLLDRPSGHLFAQARCNPAANRPAAEAPSQTLYHTTASLLGPGTC